MIEIIKHPNAYDWSLAYQLALGTEGKTGEGTVPSKRWMERILLAEHSPIRSLEWIVEMTDVPYWVAMHLVRHKYGVEWFVQSQRNDRQDKYDRNTAPQNAPVTVRFVANAQALINISRKRLCHKAAKETRELWEAVVAEIVKDNPEMEVCLVPDCVYRGKCHEMKPCGRGDAS